MNRLETVNSTTADTMQLALEIFERLGVSAPSNQQISLVQAMFDYLATERCMQFDSSLSRREQTCLSLLAQGKSFEEIAGLMHIKRTTVATFIKRIKNKLGCDTLPQMVYEGMKFKGAIKIIEPI
jgi:DNA-binding CsgD family transcriptional regulator